MKSRKLFNQEGFCVSPRKEVEIRNIAEQVRKLFYPYNHKYLDVIDFLERKMPLVFEYFRYEIVEPHELPDREAEMDPIGFCIRIQEPIYERAIANDGHCRFTIAHELGHWFLHREQTLAFGQPALNGDIPIYRHSEWQADVFARNFLAPWSLAKGMTARQIEMLFEVSPKVAAIISGEPDVKQKRPKASFSAGPMLPGFEFL